MLIALEVVVAFSNAPGDFDFEVCKVDPPELFEGLLDVMRDPRVVAEVIVGLMHLLHSQ